MWSLMDLNALGFLSTPCRLYCSSSGGSIGFKFKLNLESGSCEILTLTNFPSEFLIHWNINSYKKNKTTLKRKKKQFYQKGLMLAKKISSEMKLSKLTVKC